MEDRKDNLGKLSTLLLITSLVAETVCLVRTNQISGEVLGSLTELSDEAFKKATKAKEDAGTAITQSGQAVTKAGLAEEASGRAIDKSSKAEGAASTAMTLARGARQEADTFETRLASAEQKAGDAEAHLAEALQRAIEATQALDHIRLPRSLTNIPELVSTLEPFKDTEYTFSSVFQDSESVDLLKSLDAVLQRAGWKRTKPPAGFPALNVYGTQQDFSVPVGVSTGIGISADSLTAWSLLASRPKNRLPPLVRAAISLNEVLPKHISPGGNKKDVNPVEINVGESNTIRIAIGKKP